MRLIKIDVASLDPNVGAVRTNTDLMLAAYNAGTKPVDECRGIPRFPETQEYVRRVRTFQGIYRQGDAKASLAAPVVARADLPAERSKGPAECRPPCGTSDRGLLD